MSKITLESRVAALRLCHEEIIDLEDEEAYEWWIAMGVPDEPTKDDFEYIARNDEEYEDTLKLAKKIIYEYGGKVDE